MNRGPLAVPGRRAGKGFVLFRSSFTRVLAGFLLVITIVASADLLSLRVYVRNMEREITRNAGERIDNLVSGFEAQIAEIQKEFLRIYKSDLFTPVVESMNPSSFTVALLSNDLRDFLLVKNGFVKEVFIVLADSPYVVSAYGIYSGDVFFGTAYRSEVYSHQFWRRMLGADFTFTAYPARRFVDGTVDPARPATLLPLAFKSAVGSRFLIVAYLDIEKLLRSLEPAFSEGLVISRADDVIFPVDAPLGADELRSFAGRRFTRSEGGYEFVRSSEKTGLLYYKRVPATAVDRQLRESALIFSAILLLSVAVSVAVSVYVANRFNNPVKSIVELLRTTRTLAPARTVSDLKFISDSTERIALQNAIKNADGNLAEVRKRLSIGSSYRLVLFVLHRRSPQAVVSGLADILGAGVRAWSSESVTLELQDDQIVSIVNVPGGSGGSIEPLNLIVGQAGLEGRDVFLTIVVGRIYQEASDLHAAYLRVVEAARYRRVTDQTQVVEDDLADKEQGRFFFSAEQSARFRSLLAAEKREECSRLVGDLIDHNVKQGVVSLYLCLLCTELITCSIQVMTGMLYEVPPDLNVSSTHARLEKCATASDFRRLMEGFVDRVAGFIHANRKPSDYIIDSIRRYVEEHYGEEVYLDLLADRLNITKNYLSGYFKSRTGTNLSEYISGYRIAKAKELMAATNLKIKDIAARVGIGNTNTFIRVFRKHTGRAPREFRRQDAAPGG